VPRPPKPADEPFDIDRITAVLDRERAEAATPPATAGGSDTPDSTASIGALIGASQPRMTLSEIEALRSRLAGCWRQPAGWSDPAEIRVVLLISLNRDGSVARPPEVVEAPAGRYQQVAAESARRAVYECAPYNLPVAKYEDWRALKMTFDPTAAGGAG
jgi:hypothetical protein